MAPPVLFADATALVVDHLRSKLASDPGPTTPDPASNQSRYRQSFIVAIRGAALQE
jgi:hypothetical protein